VEGSCEHGIEPSSSIKCWEVLEGLYNWQLLKKGSASGVCDGQKSYRRAFLFKLPPSKSYISRGGVRFVNVFCNPDVAFVS
jgi:hypothetical protein